MNTWTRDAILLLVAILQLVDRWNVGDASDRLGKGIRSSRSVGKSTAAIQSILGNCSARRLYGGEPM